jgi:hypothetical protein
VSVNALGLEAVKKRRASNSSRGRRQAPARGESMLRGTKNTVERFAKPP